MIWEGVMEFWRPADRPEVMIIGQARSGVFDSVPNLEDKLNADTMLSLIYIAGCVERKHQGETADTTEYYERHSAYLDALDRGELCVPGDNIAQWTIYCFVLFIQFSEDLCRKFVIAQFTDIAEKYCFDVTPSQCRVLANIFMNNYSILKSPDSTKEARLKELKLEWTTELFSRNISFEGFQSILKSLFKKMKYFIYIYIHYLIPLVPTFPYMHWNYQG